ncbi:MAG: hypothetical protein CVU56_26525 [Deltaproteobacteria bacterium HGW-Deltaproteobacteria-14]|jgi:hypothetical protein|nr:MAG: hypothetical protein CVU56_26525 [Deltaproteobacteria bacterium HGW-Deltaproteobacteria-14]
MGVWTALGVVACGAAALGCGGGASATDASSEPDTVDASTAAPDGDAPDAADTVAEDTAAEDLAPPYPIAEPVGPWFACGDADTPPGATIVMAHDRADQYFIGWEEDQNQRVVDAVADFPSAGAWRRVLLRVELACPGHGACDWWDRSAAVSLLDGPDAEPIELARYMTPYRAGLCFVADVTDFASRLSGPKTIRSFIDTWVGPGHAQGDGWRVTTRFIFHPGRPGPEDPAFASELVPLWNNNAADAIVEIGDPARPLSDDLPPRTVTIPAHAKAVKLLLLATGHGQGNLHNCAEFCTLTHIVSWSGAASAGVVRTAPWRGDCGANPVSDQSGTWTLNRAGWCPGAMVVPELHDITAQVTPGDELTLAYGLEDPAGAAYVNSCRPGAGDASEVCSGCGFNQRAGNCDWDWSLHTPPYLRIGAQLLIFR